MAYKKSSKKFSKEDKKNLINEYQEQINSYFLGLADHVSDKLISDLEKGIPPWESPVMDTHYHNPESGANYNFENSILLWAATEGKNYSSNKFVTAKQGFDAGLSMEKGTTGYKIVQRFGMPLGTMYETDTNGNYKKDENGKLIPQRDENGDIKKLYKRAAKLVTVFNIDQFKGEIPKRWLKDEKKPTLDNNEEMILFRNALEASSECPILRHKSSKNYYLPPLDHIKLSNSDLFKSTLQEISTMAHEMAHATGHESRLNRETVYTYAKSDCNRGYEELVANFASRGLTEKYRLPEKEVKASYLNNHDSYDMGWMIPVIKEDIKLVFDAAQDANRAFKRVDNKFQEELKKEPKLKEFVEEKMDKEFESPKNNNKTQYRRKRNRP